LIFNLDIELQPKQSLLAENLNESFPGVIGFGGAKGGAKSHAMRTLINLHLWEYPGTNGLIFRKTYSELLENHIMRLFRDYPYMREWYIKNDKIIEYPNGSTLRFGFAEYDSDIEPFNGKEYGIIGIDQAEQLSQYMIAILKGSNRSTVPGYAPKFILTFNPGGISHAFLKTKFVDRNLTDGERKEGWMFIQSHGWDNVEWVTNSLIEEKVSKKEYYEWTDLERKEYFLKNAPYAQNLMSLPDDDLVEAYLWGRWDVFSGQFFTKFRQDTHVVPDSLYLDERYERRGSIDYGSTTVFNYGCRSPNGSIYIENECYTEDMTPSERASVIATMLMQNKIWKLLIYADTDMFSDFRNYTGAEKSPAQIMNEVFTNMMGPMAPTLIPVSKKSEDARKYRVLCNEAFKEYLNWKKNPDGEFSLTPRLFMKERCVKLITTLPGLVYDKKNRSDIDPAVGNDHPYDAAKYLVMSLREQRRPGEAITIEEDPTQWLIHNVLIPQQRRLKLAEKTSRTFMQY